MAAEARSPRQKRVAGAAVLGGVVAVAWLATSVPRLFESTRIAYVATTSMATGADGLKAGGLVLYGGAPRGHITAIETRLSNSGSTGEIRIDFELDRALPLAPNASIVKSVGVAGSGGALSILAPGDPEYAFSDTGPRVIPMNRGTVEAADGATVLFGRHNAGLLRSIETSLARIGDQAPPRIARLARQVRSLRTLLDRLELDVGADELAGSAELRVATIVNQLQRELPGLRAALAGNGEALDELRQDVAADTGRIRRGLDAVDRDLAELGTESARIESRIDASFLPKVLAMRRDILRAMADAQRSIADGEAIRSEASAAIPFTLANMTLAGGQLSIAFEDLLGLVLEAILVWPDAESETRRRLLEAVDLSMIAGMDVHAAAMRMRSLPKIDERSPRTAEELRTVYVEPFEAAVDRLERNLDELARILGEAFAGDDDPGSKQEP